jgi:hypothetical protein
MATIVDGYDSKWVYGGPEQTEYVAAASGKISGEWSQVMANASLIALAPTLAAEVLALRAENDRLRQEVAIARTALGHEGMYFGNDRAWEAMSKMNAAKHVKDTEI